MKTFSSRSVFGRRTNAILANCWKYLPEMSWVLDVVSCVEKRSKNLFQICIRCHGNFVPLIQASGVSGALCASMLHFSLIRILVYRGNDRKRVGRNLREYCPNSTVAEVACLGPERRNGHLGGIKIKLSKSWNFAIMCGSMHNQSFGSVLFTWPAGFIVWHKPNNLFLASKWHESNWFEVMSCNGKSQRVWSPCAETRKCSREVWGGSV